MGVDLRKKTKDLSVSEREDRGYEEGVSTEDVHESPLCTGGTFDVVCSRKAAHSQPPSLVSTSSLSWFFRPGRKRP